MKASQRRIVQERTIVLAVRAPGYKLPFVIYSGFIVELSGNWVWFTSAHGRKQISQTFEEWPRTTVEFLNFVEGGHRIPLPRSEIQFVDFQDIHQEKLLELGDLSQKDQRDIKNLDIAFTFISMTTRLNLGNGLGKAFTLNDMSDDLSMYSSDETHDLACYVVGVPASSYYPPSDPGSALINIYPLHPEPNDVVSRETLRVEDFFVWMPAYWIQDDGDNDLTGVSGGPALLVINDTDVLLIGMEVSQIISSRVKLVGICPIESVAKSIAFHLKEHDLTII